MIYHTLILWKYRHVLLFFKGSGASAFLALCARGEVGTRVPWPAVGSCFFFGNGGHVFAQVFFEDDYFI